MNRDKFRTMLTLCFVPFGFCYLIAVVGSRVRSTTESEFP